MDWFQLAQNRDLLWGGLNAVMDLRVVCFLGNSPESEVYMPSFGTLFHLHGQVEFYVHLPVYEDGTDGVFRNVGI